MDFSGEVGGRWLEYVESGHLYLVDGIIVPSVTQMLDAVLGFGYSGVAPEVLAEAARKGTAVHEAIQRWNEAGEESELPELASYKSMTEDYGFKARNCEQPVIICHEGRPVAAGRYDLELGFSDGRIGGADIKRQSRVKKERVALQLNLYRIGVRQTYGRTWELLACLRLREAEKQYIPIAIDEAGAVEAIKKYMEGTR